MIRLSLIIPTHNRAGQLLAALESVVRQDMPAGEWECVVVNNNSTDDTPARFAAFAARYPALNLRMVTETGPGFPMPATGDRGNFGALHGLHRRRRTYQCGVYPGVCRILRCTSRCRRGRGRIIAEYVSGRPAWMSKYTELPVANPMDFGHAVRPFPAGRVPGEATWLSAAPQPSDTAGSTPRWGVWDGC